MPFSVDPVTVNDAEPLATVMMAARWDDPHWVTLWHESISLDQIIADCAQRLPWNLVNGRDEKRHQKAVDVDSGEIVGYARWLLPSSLVQATETAWKEAQGPDADDERRLLFAKKWREVVENGGVRGLRGDMVECRSTPLEEADAEIMKDGPYLSLDYLTTAPAHQRRGAGAMLLKSGLEVADAHGLKTYVMSSPAGLKLYLNHGFELKQTVSVDYAQYGGTEPTVNYFLVRQPVLSTKP